MILFLADNHFGSYPGRNLYQSLKEFYPIDFYEDTLESLNNDLSHYSLLVLNLICGTPGSPEPEPAMESSLKEYCLSGKPLLLLHGSSAAFSDWPWWRKQTGLRWVRNDDPEGMPPSQHPITPYYVSLVSSEHPLSGRLKEFKSAEDELYIDLAQSAPYTPLMETHWEGAPYTQCYVKETIGGGKLAAFIPGHRSEVVTSEAVLHNISQLIDWLQETDA